MTEYLESAVPSCVWTDCRTMLLFLLCSVAVVVVLGVALLIVPVLFETPSSERRTHIRVESIQSPTNKKPPPLSIVIPAFNEQDRLPSMLQAAHEYFTNNQDAQEHVEWIIVNDGSTDQTPHLTFPTIPHHSYKWVHLHKNSGKGAAVQQGMLQAQGDYCLMVDADGATDFAVGLPRLQQRLLRHDEIAFGSRYNPNDTTANNNNRSLLRRTLTFLFHTLKQWIIGTHIHDTQCGFKLFPNAVVRVLFRDLHVTGWAFDMELVLRANRMQYNIHEVHVPWHEVEGSKLHTSLLALILNSLAMLRDLLRVRLCYGLGIWKMKPKAI